MSKTVSYFHAVNSGDLISSLPGMKHVYETTGKKAVIYQRLGMACNYYEGAKHPVKDEKGIQVTMNKKQWDLLTPLLLSQDYVESCHVWEGETVDINLNKSREGDFTTMGYGMIQRWNWYCFPAMACDLSKPWLSVPEIKDFNINEKVILNFTERYRNSLISYYFLKKYEDRLIFAGTKDEYKNFCLENNLQIPYLEINNFYELAQYIRSCKFFLGCQSMCWNIAEALKIPRLLEVCKSACNCIPVGDLAYDFLQQGALEFYFQRLIGEIPELSKEPMFYYQHLQEGFKLGQIPIGMDLPERAYSISKEHYDSIIELAKQTKNKYGKKNNLR